MALLLGSRYVNTSCALRDDGTAAVRSLAEHPEAARYATFGDFAPWVLAVDRARYVEGFGVMSFVPGEAYRGAFA